MKINDDFYEKILKQEEFWSNLMDRNLINIYYITGSNGLKDFYTEKYMILKDEYNTNPNEIVYYYIKNIEKIIAKINYLALEYKKNNDIDVNEIRELFFINKLKVTKKERKEIIENNVRQYNMDEPVKSKCIK